MKGEPGQVVPGPPGIDGVDGMKGEPGQSGTVGAKGEKGICHAQWYIVKLYKKPTGNKVSIYPSELY